MWHTSNAIKSNNFIKFLWSNNSILYANFKVNSIIQFANDMKHFGNQIQCFKIFESVWIWVNYIAVDDISLHAILLGLFDLDDTKTTLKSFYVFEKKEFCLVLLISGKYNGIQKALMRLNDHKHFPTYYRKALCVQVSTLPSPSAFYSHHSLVPLYIASESLFIVLGCQWNMCCTCTSMRR